MLDLVPLWGGILAIAVLMYVLLDGFDLGVGMLFLFRTEGEDRDIMVNSVAPVWDFNETWLILGGGGMLAVFPLAFAIIMPAVYFPVLLMLVGLIFRGVAFEFREISRRRRLWDAGFAWGSLLAALAQGVTLGMFVQGFEVTDRSFSGSSWDWLRPFPLLCAIGLAFGYGLQGSTWLVLKTEGNLQRWARKAASVCLMGVLALIGLVSIWTPLVSERIASRWFGMPQTILFAPVPVLTVLVAWRLEKGLRRGDDLAPFLCSIGVFVLAFVGLVISLWPFIAPPAITLHDAAAAPASQAFLMLGTLFLLPVVLLYIFWSYWVFRGKVRGNAGYSIH